MARSTNEELASAARALGGTEDDLKLVAEADFSGSEYEFEGDGVKEDLKSDVEKLWSELAGTQAATNKAVSSAGKKKLDSKEPLKIGSKDNASDKITRKPSERAAKPDSGAKISAKPKDRQEPQQEKKSGPELPKQIPKALRLRWSEYLNEIDKQLAANHDLLLREELDSSEELHWSDLCNSSTPAERPTQDIADALQRKARALLDQENATYYTQRSKDRDFANSLEFLKRGTFSDQLGTLSILATESPIHSVRFFDSLYAKCEIKNRESACKALEVFKDLVVSHVLPDRRLRWFRDQPLAPGLPLKVLVAWSFEDYFKNLYFTLLRTLESLLADTVENIRLRALYCVFDLFQRKPEQEANLLRLGVNKFGDSSRKVCSRVKKLLLDALQQHPGMKTIVAAAIWDLLKRSKEYRVRYYAADALSEFIFTTAHPEVANTLINIYLDLFEQILTESRREEDTRVEKPVEDHKRKSAGRMRVKRGRRGGVQQAKLDESELERQKQASLVAKIFTGLNRAFPFSTLDAKVFARHTDTLYHMSHSQNVGTLVEALSFIFQLLKQSKEIGVDRFYKALYDSLSDPRLVASAKLGKFLLLLLRATAELRAEAEQSRANAFAKRELEVACGWLDAGGAASLIHVAGRTPFLKSLMAPRNETDSLDMRQRDPRFAKAETSHAWEILLLQNHFHPTVALYASNLLVDEPQELPLPDIEQYSVNNFLSKWSYKKPRAKDASRGASIFQPLPGFTDLSLGLTKTVNDQTGPASVVDWSTKSADHVAPDEQFLFQYFKHRPTKIQPSSSEQTKVGSDDEDAEDLDEEEISEAMFKSGPGDLDDAPELEISEDESDGDLEAGLDAAFASSSDDDEAADSDEAPDNALIDAEFGDGSDTEIPGSSLEDDKNDTEHSFADFGEDKEEKNPKKRKREWNDYPTFLDADAFEEMYEKKKVAKK